MPAEQRRAKKTCFSFGTQKGTEIFYTFVRYQGSKQNAYTTMKTYSMTTTKTLTSILLLLAVISTFSKTSVVVNGDDMVDFTDQLIPCGICTDGGFPTINDAVLASFIGGFLPVTCGQAQAIGLARGYTLQQCATAQALARNTCGCPNEPTPSPVSAPSTPAPTAAPPTVFCLICPNGNRVTGLGVLGSLQCQDVDKMGRERKLTSEQCLAAQTRTAQEDDPCDCLPPTPGT